MISGSQALLTINSFLYILLENAHAYKTKYMHTHK